MANCINRKYSENFLDKPAKFDKNHFDKSNVRSIDPTWRLTCFKLLNQLRDPNIVAILIILFYIFYKIRLTV